MTNLPEFLPVKAEPDFENILAVLRGEEPSRPTLFEFFHNDPLYIRLAGSDFSEVDERLRNGVLRINGFRNAGYDYANVGVPGFTFPKGEHDGKQTYSINEGGLISDRASFDAYPWPSIDDADFDYLADLAPYLPDGMKFIVSGPGGVEENAIGIVGYETLCYMMADDEGLVGDLFEAIGSRLVEYYRRVCTYDCVGACISNDDWGFKTSSLFSIEQMERFLFPWHKEIVEVIQASGRPAILHSCGLFDHIVDHIADDLNYDGRHSYEDAILPVEDAYEKYHSRFAILGGIDLDFICRETPEAIYQRSKAMIERSQGRGAYALGTGNSVPAYTPDDGFFAMIRAAVEDR
ncbi:MAG: uroporphyrinogen decarboxylase family protein [Planctomycetota bacterium]|jgi:uroporphyrinogen decarboxylase